MPAGLYVHVPFCRVRCAYCDFAIVAGQERRAGEYVDAVAAEAERLGEEFAASTFDTLYLGGGTPSRLGEREFATLIEAVRGAFDGVRLTEFSVEANPEDIAPDRVDAWRRAGVDRVTLGVQSLDDRVLAGLGRPGSRRESLDALEQLRRCGVERVGVDLIFGGPGQTLESWRGELREMLGQGVGHLSLYALETTSRTPLVRAVERGEAAVADGDAMAEMYEAAVEMCAVAGLDRYEVSNFARPGEKSLHNLKHWTDQPYLGLGQSAASYMGGERWVNPRRYSDYVKMARGGAAPVEREPYDAGRRAGEALMFGLRTREGVDLERLAQRYGEEALARRRGVLERAVAGGLAVEDGARVRLTGRGLLVADELFVDLM